MILLAAFWGLSAMAQNDMIRSVDNAAFSKAVYQDGAQLIDVRTADEYTQRHLPKAVNMDVQSPDFDKKISTLDKSKPVAVYCRSGARSLNAAQQLAKKGYKVINLSKGISGWNGEVVKD